MGVLVSNTRRQVKTVLNGRTHTGMETVAIINDGKLVRLVAGKEEGSKLDGSEYTTAFVQVKPGHVIRIVGYDTNAQALQALKTGDTVSGVLTPMPRNWFKLAELAEPETQTAA
jgi:hypothetical protein